MAALQRSQLPRELLHIIQNPLPLSPLLRTRYAPRMAAALTLNNLNRRLSTTAPLRNETSNSSSTVDPTEISHFNALASSWWDPYGPSRLLHLMNPLRHTFIQSCLASSPISRDPAQKLHYLDIGCGGGIFAESAARLRNTASVTALDPSPEVLRVAEAHRRRDPLLMEEGRLTYINTTIEALASPSSRADIPTEAKIPNNGFDIVTAFEVLEHVTSPVAFLTSATQLVRPGGWLIGSTIARTNLSWFVTKFMAEDVLRMVPRGTHDWNKYVHEWELREWFDKKGGWSTARSVGVCYVPLLGWREVPFRGGEGVGNYFFGFRRDE